MMKSRDLYKIDFLVVYINMEEFSVCKGDINKVKEWIKTNDVHVFDNYALRFSAVNGHLEVVRELIKAGANIYVDNNFALRYSAHYKHLEVAHELLKYYKYVRTAEFCGNIKSKSRIDHYINLTSIMIDLPRELYDEIAQFI